MGKKDIVVDGLGARLKEVRERNGWTQAQVAAWSGIGTNHLAQFELETRKPGAENLAKLARGLRVTSDWLLGLEG